MKPLSVVPSISVRKFKEYIQRFSRARILVLGDLILDHYVWGKVHRVSPEAPVPVVHVDSESYRMGGAANVYHNILTLGGQAELCGVVGADPVGKQFLADIRRSSPFTSGVIVDSSRPTIKKTRVVAHNQQIVRFDVEQRHDISSQQTKKIIRHVASRLPGVSCLVISDYAKGMITADLMKTIHTLAGQFGVPIVVDPKVEHMAYYQGVTVITPNHLEAKQAAGFLPSQDVPVEQIGLALQQRLQCQAIVITRGEEGMSIFNQRGQSWSIPAVARQVYDVTGAGDTVISTLALALSAKASLPEAAVLANQAAGIVVGMVGTATVTRTQLQKAVLHGPN
ncbi:MAG: D-glycero-beta-D-manno-heptose-7-phosphate kinase [Nitrospira sp.]|nr:D-glycero-beta-D-manno-heptose-7-phosphate kinase [Nitrospira sp.]